MGNVIKIGICDDDPEAVKQVALLLKEYEKNNVLLGKLEILVFNSAPQLLAHEGNLDLLYLDIELGEMSGVDIAPTLQMRFPEMIIIFISVYSKYFVYSHRLKVFQFLTKPFDAIIFFEELDRFFNKYNCKRAIYQFEFKGQKIQFPANEILYIESKLRYLNIFHIRMGGYEKLAKLNEEEERLQPLGFIRCHQSYLVNAQYIENIKSTQIELKNPYTKEIVALPISRKYSKSITRDYHFWMLGQ